MIDQLEKMTARQYADAGWLEELAPQSRVTATGRVELGLSEPGIVCFRLSGEMELDLARGFTELLDQLYAQLAVEKRRCFMVIEAIRLERLSFQAQHYLLNYGKHTVPDIVGVHCAVANPLFRALLRLFQRLKPQGRLLISWYSSCEAALEAARVHLRQLQLPLSDIGPELGEAAFESEHLSLRFYRPAPHIVLSRVKGVLNQTGALHLIETHSRLFRDLRERFGRAVIIIDCIETRHTTIDAYRIMGRTNGDSQPRQGDRLVVTTRHWPRAVEALTQRLLRHKGYQLRIVASIEEALQAVSLGGGESQPVEAAPARPLPWFGLRRQLRAQQAEIDALRAEREDFLSEAGTVLADILLHKDSSEVHRISPAQMTSAYHEIYESLYLLQSEYQEYLSTLQQEIDVRISAERDAAESSQIKNRFLANVSHELRTPLNAIIGFTNLLQRGKAGPLSQTQGLYVERVRDNSMHLLALINDVLDISKIESGTLHLNREPIALPEFLDRVLEPLQVQAQAKGLNLELRLEPGAPAQLRSDPDRLRQIVSNLVGNALKFTATGGVTVRCRDWPSPSHPLALEIADTGIGIAPEHQKRIFEAFTQLHAGSYPGAGLGLSICLNLAYALGCRLELESEPGQGSLFRLLLPEAMLPA